MNAPLIQPLYGEVQHGTWSLLYGRQRENLTGKAAELYLKSLDQMSALTEMAIPRVDLMTKQLQWRQVGLWPLCQD